MNREIKVIIVEDDLDLRESTVEYLTLAGHDVCGVGSCLEFYRALADSSFSVAVVDVGLPDQSGYVLAEYLRNNTTMGIIMLTARDAVEDRVRGYSSGADLYLVKPVDCRELAAAIASLSVRLGNRNPATAQAPVSEVWNLVRQTWLLVPPVGSAVLLTAKEMQFMECLAQNAGRPATRDKFLAALGYRDDEYASRAMDSLVRRLRRKIEEDLHLSPPIKTIHGVGYCFTAPLVVS